MPTVLDSLMAVLALFPYFLEALVLFFLGKFVFDLTTPGIRDDRELTESRNPAFGVFWGGYMGGLALAIAGALGSLGPSLLDNAVDLATSGLAAIVLLRLSMAIGQRLVLRGFDVSKEIVEDRNLGAGFAFAGLFLASGLVIAGVMSGRSDSWATMALDIAVYWAAGQAILAASWFAYRLMTGYNVHLAIGEGNNAAAGLSLGGFFVAMGIILRAALTNAGSDLGPELLISLAVGVAGLLLLVLARFLTTLVLLPRLRLADEVAKKGNLAAGAVSATTYIAVALLLGSLVTSQLQ
jgi:uncharacterized membrane protein YjfL (UPF0719 family)